MKTKEQTKPMQGNLLQVANELRTALAELRAIAKSNPELKDNTMKARQILRHLLNQLGLDGETNLGYVYGDPEADQCYEDNYERALEELDNLICEEGEAESPIETFVGFLPCFRIADGEDKDAVTAFETKGDLHNYYDYCIENGTETLSNGKGPDVWTEDEWEEAHYKYWDEDNEPREEPLED